MAGIQYLFREKKNANQFLPKNSLVSFQSIDQSFNK